MLGGVSTWTGLGEGQYPFIVCACSRARGGDIGEGLVLLHDYRVIVQLGIDNEMKKTNLNTQTICC